MEEKKYTTVCFDIDGTLYPTALLNKILFFLVFRHPKVCKAYNQLRAEFRKRQSGFENSGFSDKSFKEREASIFYEISKTSDFIISRNFRSVDEASEFLERKYYQTLHRIFKRKLRYQPESVRTLRMLKENGIKTGAFSDWPLWSKLELIGVKPYIDFAACPDDTGYLKPDKRCIEYLLKRLDAEASSTLYVGDSYNKDIVGAVNAGVDAVLVYCNGIDYDEARSKYPKALKVFENWSDFDKWLFEHVKH